MSIYILKDPNIAKSQKYKYIEEKTLGHREGQIFLTKRKTVSTDILDNLMISQMHFGYAWRRKKKSLY